MVEYVREVKRGLKQWKGWRLDLVDARRGEGGGEGDFQDLVGKDELNMRNVTASSSSIPHKSFPPYSLTFFNYLCQNLLILFDFLGTDKREITPLSFNSDIWNTVDAKGGLLAYHQLYIHHPFTPVLHKRSRLVIRDTSIRQCPQQSLVSRWMLLILKVLRI